jgi:hypothetical protein
MVLHPGHWYIGFRHHTTFFHMAEEKKKAQYKLKVKS